MGMTRLSVSSRMTAAGEPRSEPCQAPASTAAAATLLGGSGEAFDPLGVVLLHAHALQVQVSHRVLRDRELVVGGPDEPYRGRAVALFDALPVVERIAERELGLGVPVLRGLGEPRGRLGVVAVVLAL